ncbi:hypothetical protein A3A50_04270 [Candidatus Woesebacteria bacterium RIFCSPLOWO2_01_FULL_38_20]|nr:MAG: hypothetical protein A3A50_04270 [Candidatus Woesebacteria bacterium RIFCSPLOWO2_01_FULL_38_20]
MPIVGWVKKNKLATFLILVVSYLFLKNFFGVSPFSLTNQRYSAPTDLINPSSGASFGSTSGVAKIGLPNLYPQQDYTPQSDVQNRLVIQESNLSLLVKDVVDVRNKILNYTSQNGGYMVNVSTSNPQDTPTATIMVRVPADKLQNALDYFHSLSIKVVSENLIGKDVTDQYIDIETRIKLLENTKFRYEDILQKATLITDITNLTQQILSTQSQIDSLKGQQVAFEKNAQLAKLTIYLSTDEIALPYAPSETFRPNVIFKLAVRSLIGSLRQLATWVIWIATYSVIWLPALVIFILVRKWWKKRNKVS